MIQQLICVRKECANFQKTLKIFFTSASRCAIIKSRKTIHHTTSWRYKIIRNAIEIAADIRNAAEWDNDLCAELCEAAGMENEWNAADGETFESVVNAAAKKLGVEIY